MGPWPTPTLERPLHQKRFPPRKNDVHETRPEIGVRFQVHKLFLWHLTHPAPKQWPGAGGGGGDRVHWKMGQGRGAWVWTSIWWPILRLTGRPGRSTMASLMTLHIGRPCHAKCTPQALDEPRTLKGRGRVGIYIGKNRAVWRGQRHTPASRTRSRAAASSRTRARARAGTGRGAPASA